MQVHVRTNIAPSKALEDRSRAADGVIRLLRREIASIRFLDGREIPLYGAYGITICAVWEDAEIPPYGK